MTPGREDTYWAASHEDRRRLDLKIAIACGGTGGHVLPGYRTAQELRGRGHEVTLWLGGRDVERASIEGWDGPVVRIASEGFQSRSTIGRLRVLGRLAVATWRSRRRMRENVPDVMLAMGSYASVGPALASRSLRVPLVLHEANAVPGKAVEFLSRFATGVAVGFRAAVSGFQNVRVVVTGFPVRSDLLGLEKPGGRTTNGLFTVLVMGGSQGAHRLNELASEAICRVHERGGGVRAIHLTGRTDEAGVRDRYARAGVPCEVHGFLSDMSRAYGPCDLALSRAGAGSCAELAACGIPSLLIPLPSAARDHQMANARAMEELGGVDVAEERTLTVEGLADYLIAQMGAPARLAEMRRALGGALAGPGVASANAVRLLSDFVEDCARRSVT